MKISNHDSVPAQLPNPAEPVPVQPPQDFSVFALTEIRRDLQAMRELAIGSLALLDTLRDQQASAEAAAEKAVT